MAHFKYVPKNGQKGKVTYSGGIVRGIVALAVEEIDGASLLDGKKNTPSDGIKINFEKEGVYVDVNINMNYGYSVPDIACKIQEKIKHSVETMSEYKIANVDVHIIGVTFDDETK